MNGPQHKLHRHTIIGTPDTGPGTYGIFDRDTGKIRMAGSTREEAAEIAAGWNGERTLAQSVLDWFTGLLWRREA